LILKTIIPLAIIGAVLGIAIGFAVASLSGTASFGFMLWAGLRIAEAGHGGDALAWTIGGAVVGTAAAFLWRPNSN
jgi:hypothetical protein